MFPNDEFNPVSGEELQPVQKVPAPEVVTQEMPVQEIPVQEAPVQQIPVQEALVQEMPVQEAPVQEMPVQEAPVQETPVQEMPVQETPVQEMPVQKVPAPEAQLGTAESMPQPQQPRVQPISYAQPLYQAPVYGQPAQPVKKPKSQHWGRKLLAAVLVVALVVGSCFATAAIVNQRWMNGTAQMKADFQSRLDDLQQQIDDLSGYADNGNSVSGSPLAEAGSLTPGQVYAQNVDAVVMITCQVSRGQYGQKGTSTGSGFIISQDGYVVTNHHVVENATSVTVITHTGQEIPARVVGSDSINDVAVVKAEAEGLPFVQLGSSRALIVGDQVVAIGNPLGELTSTMTVGYVSGKERSVTTDGITIDMIQTDAAINSGSSGGPLFNMKGQVVGITTAKYSGKSSSGASIEGIGFAIPMDDVLPIIRELQENGYIKTPFMGVTVAEMNADMRILAQAYNMPVGLTVQEIEPDGPALAAGILVDDIIIALDGRSITAINDLSRALRDYEVGEAVTVTVFRAGMRLELMLVLAERPKDLDSTPQLIEPSMPGSGDFD